MTPQSFNAFPRLSAVLQRDSEIAEPMSSSSYAMLEALDRGETLVSMPDPEHAPPEAQLDSLPELDELPELPSNAGYAIQATAPPSPWALTATITSAPEVSPSPAASAVTVADYARVLESAPLHIVIREAIRAKAIDMAAAPKRHNAYELVFIMLAFSVMLLLVTPLLTDILLAAHGQRP